MSDNTKRLSRLAILAAVGVILLLMGSVLPAGRIALVALASLPVCATLMMYGLRWSVAVFCVTAFLGALIYPGAAAIMYTAFFGYYPIAKSFFERIQNSVVSWACKYELYTFAFIVYWLLARALISFTGDELPWIVLFALGAGVFWLYDRAYSTLIRFYLVKIARYFE